MQYELNEGLAAHMRKPGDPPLNPAGKFEPPAARLTRLEFNRMLWRRANMACEDIENKTKLEDICDGLIAEARARKPWAVKEVFNRLVGRVPVAIDATMTVGSTPPDSTTEELIARVERLRNEALSLRGAGTTIDVEPMDAGSNPLDAGSSPPREQPLPEGMPAKETP